MTQLALDLGHREALGREDFLVAQNNAAAVAWIDRWPDWPGPGLVIFGPAGCGKSHLAAVWQGQSDATAIAVELLVTGKADELLGGARYALIDRADSLAIGDSEAEETLLHLYNLVQERAGSMLLAARRPPKRWGLELADLSSRLSALQTVEVGAPDDTLLGAVLIKLFTDRQLKLRGEVVSYILARMERTFAAAREVVEAIDRAALETHREITVPLARSVLEALDNGQPESELQD